MTVNKEPGGCAERGEEKGRRSRSFSSPLSAPHTKRRPCHPEQREGPLENPRPNHFASFSTLINLQHCQPEARDLTCIIALSTCLFLTSFSTESFPHSHAIPISHSHDVPIKESITMISEKPTIPSLSISLTQLPTHPNDPITSSMSVISTIPLLFTSPAHPHSGMPNS